MIKAILPIVFLSLLVPLGMCSPEKPRETIRIFCWSHTPQSKAIITGLERVLDRSLPVVDAGGNYGHGERLIKQLAAEKPRLLIVLGTQALALTAPSIKKTPVVFAMVADPYHSGAAYNQSRPDDHQENITGIASPPPLAEAIQQAQNIFPARREWGLIYNPFEGPSVELKQNFAALAQQAGLNLTALGASDRVSVQAALKDLDEKGIQVVLIPPDNFSQQYVEFLEFMGKKRCFIVVNANPRITSRGAALSVTLDYEEVGEEAARLVNRLLSGEKPGDIPLIQASPALVTVDESLLNAWAGYPPGKNH